MSALISAASCTNDAADIWVTSCSSPASSPPSAPAGTATDPDRFMPDAEDIKCFVSYAEMPMRYPPLRINQQTCRTSHKRKPLPPNCFNLSLGFNLLKLGTKSRKLYSKQHTN